MKPRFDPKDPRVQEALAHLEHKARTAIAAVERIRGAVHPVFTLNPDGLRKTPEQVGSCVLLTLNGEQFLLSAAHVFEHNARWPVVVGFGRTLVPLGGERYTSVPGPNGFHDTDPVDAAVYRPLKEQVPTEMPSSSLSWEDLEVTPPPEPGFVHTLIGWPLSGARRKQKTFRSTQNVSVTLEYDAANYATLGVGRARHLATVWESQTIVDNRWKTAPTPRGMSGGALVNVYGLSPRPGGPEPDVLVPRLAATLSECRKDRGKVPGALIGARIHVHLGLIAKYDEELRNWMDARDASPPTSSS